MIEKVVKEAGTDSVSGFTDGSCRGNPGPCGAGASLFFPRASLKKLLVCCLPTKKIRGRSVGRLFFLIVEVN